MAQPVSWSPPRRSPGTPRKSAPIPITSIYSPTPSTPLRSPEPRSSGSWATTRVESLLSAFPAVARAVPDAHLLIVGDGPVAPQVAELAAELGAGKVTTTGAVPHAEVASWLRLARVGVAPYPKLDDFYFSPMKIVEYQAAGLAVVASDIGHIREQIVHGSTGYLLPPSDDGELARRLIDLARRPQEAARLGASARRHVLRHSTWGSVAERVEQLFERAAPSRFGWTAAGAG